MKSYLLSSFELSKPLSNDAFSLLTNALGYHQLKKEKKLLWMNFGRAFLWITWQEHNDLECSFDRYSRFCGYLV